jgi:hypothetical protein
MTAPCVVAETGSHPQKENPGRTTMSSSIYVYLVSTAQLKQGVGSGDGGLLSAIIIDQDDFLARIDEIDEEAEFICAEAVADLIHGRTQEECPEYLYGYALEAICAQVGKELANICPIVRASDWINDIDAQLVAAGVPVSLEMLVFGGSPVPIPTPEDYPCIGTWPAEKIPTALAAMNALDLSSFDDETETTFDQIKEWLKAAATKPGSSLIGFLS